MTLVPCGVCENGPVLVLFHSALAFILVGALAKLRAPRQSAAAFVSLLRIRWVGKLWVVRALGCVELSPVVLALLGATKAAAILAALLYAVFSFAIELGMARGVADCGCLGGSVSPPTRGHSLLCFLFALCCLTVTVNGVDSFSEVISSQPMLGIPYLLALGTTAALLAHLVGIATELAALVSARRSGVVR
jgi:hypothetical protein